ncbi:MAG: hypothetical protein WC825_10805, partial [Gallionellaceae bacterium]
FDQQYAIGSRSIHKALLARKPVKRNSAPNEIGIIFSGNLPSIFYSMEARISPVSYECIIGYFFNFTSHCKQK